MIDPSTGRILLPLPGLWIEPSLTREAFLASAVAKDCPKIFCTEPRCTVWLPTSRFEGYDFDCLLQFQGSVLEMVDLTGILPKPLPAEGFLVEVSNSGEMTLHRLHNFLLTRALGPRWSFPWGEVTSGFDPKGNGTSVTVKYWLHRPHWGGAPTDRPLPPRRGCLGSVFWFLAPESLPKAKGVER